MSIEGLEKLKVWQKAREYALAVYRTALKCLPVEEKYGLDPQLRRAASSIPANIAEGYGRYYYQDMIRFCYIARGSLEETVSHLTLAHDLNYLSPSVYRPLMAQASELTRLINGYIAYLKQSKQGEHEPGSTSVHEALTGYDFSLEEEPPDITATRHDNSPGLEN